MGLFSEEEKILSHAPFHHFKNVKLIIFGMVSDGKSEDENSTLPLVIKSEI